mgnify:CR=1 FL=1
MANLAINVDVDVAIDPEGIKVTAWVDEESDGVVVDDLDWQTIIDREIEDVSLAGGGPIVVDTDMNGVESVMTIVNVLRDQAERLEEAIRNSNIFIRSEWVRNTKDMEYGADKTATMSEYVISYGEYLDYMNEYDQ